MLPKEYDILLPLLEEIKIRGGRTRPSDSFNGKNVYEALAEHFKLSKEDLDQEVSDPSENKWENRVRFARKDLVDLGLISNAEHGVWELSDKGRDSTTRKNVVSGARKRIEKKEVFKMLIDAGCSREQALEVAKLNESDVD